MYTIHTNDGKQLPNIAFFDATDAIVFIAAQENRLNLYFMYHAPEKK